MSLFLLAGKIQTIINWLQSAKNKGVLLLEDVNCLAIILLSKAPHSKALVLISEAETCFFCVVIFRQDDCCYAYQHA